MSDKPSEAFEEWASEEGINNFHFNHCWAAWQAALVSAGKPAALDQGYVTALIKRMQDYCDSLAPPMARGLMAEAVRALLAASPAAPAQSGEPYYLIEHRDSTPTVWWKGPRWADVTADPAKATRYGSRYAAERQMNIFGDDSLFVSEHLDVQDIAPHQEQATGLSRHQCNAIEYFVNQMRDAPSQIYIDMLDAFRDYVNSLVRDVPAAPPAQTVQSELAALEACRAIVKWCDDNPPSGDALWCVQLARQAIAAQTERVLTFAPLYKKLMRGDVDICEAYLRLKVVGSCPTQEEFCAALEALLANGAAHD